MKIVRAFFSLAKRVLHVCKTLHARRALRSRYVASRLDMPSARYAFGSICSLRERVKAPTVLSGAGRVSVVPLSTQEKALLGGSYCLSKAILLSPAVRKLRTEHRTLPTCQYTNCVKVFGGVGTLF